jgi:hypothetical protein
MGLLGGRTMPRGPTTRKRSSGVPRRCDNVHNRAMASRRYLAVHFLLRDHLREVGAQRALDAMAARDTEFFARIWTEAGFKFSPLFLHEHKDGWRLGLITLPAPRESTEAYVALVASPDAAPGTHRFILWEKGSPSPFDGSAQTFLCEWTAGGHRTLDDGPPYTGQLEVDAPAFIARCRTLLGQTAPAGN